MTNTFFSNFLIQKVMKAVELKPTKVRDWNERAVGRGRSKEDKNTGLIQSS